jgi:hypothetical protein
MRFSSSDSRTWPNHRRGFPASWMILSWIMLSTYVCSILLGRSFNTWNATPIPFCYDPFPPTPPTAPPEPSLVPDKPEPSCESEWDTDEFFASQYHRYVHRIGFGDEFEELCSHEGARSILIDSLLDGVHVTDNTVPDISPSGHHCAATSLRLGVDEITDTIRLTSLCSASAHFSKVADIFDLIIDTGASICITHDLRDFVGPLRPLFPRPKLPSLASLQILLLKVSE